MITFKLIDGKPVPHVWTMPEALFDCETNSDEDIVRRMNWNRKVDYAKDNAVPVDERFWEVILANVWAAYVDSLNDDTNIKW